MTDLKYCFFGSGHMSCALIDGMLSCGVPANNITAIRRNIEKISSLKNRGVKTSDLADDCKEAEILFLGIKPQQLDEISNQLSKNISEKTIVISMLAGVSISNLSEKLHTENIIRIMPNLACQYGKGVVGACFSLEPNTENKKMIEDVLSFFGEVQWLPEEQIDIVTAMAGSGIAYFYVIAAAIEKYAIEIGMEKEQAKKIAKQSLIGAGVLSEKDRLVNGDPKELVAKIAVSGGTTEKAVASMHKDGIEKIIANAMQAVIDRSRKL
jgi:pyrroline-5-carboxylate reductase